VRNLHTDFHSGYTNWHPHQQIISVPFPSAFSSVFAVLCLPDILTWVRFPWWLNIFNISSYIYWSFVIFHLKSVQFICPFIYWIIVLKVFNFWVLYIFRILSPCQMNIRQRFSPTLYTVFSLWWLFPLLCRSILIWCNNIC
jgi:hypothetical protein